METKNVKIFGEHDSKTLAQLYDVAKDAKKVAILADGHLGYWMPIGCVAAYDRKVCPAGVGYDIACGNAAARTDIQLNDLFDDELQQIGETIWSEISFGLKRGMMNKASNAPKDHPLFYDDRWDLIPKVDRYALKDKARNQLGTTGSGNHYVDILSDEDGYLWVGVHFGSRGFGHTIARKFMAIAAGGTWEEGKAKEGGYLLDLDTPSGQDYMDLMNLAGEYAYAGRAWVVAKVGKMLGTGPYTHYVHNHHNFAWEETHTGIGDVIIVRKGATPAWKNQEGFVGGSMGDNAVILKGYSDGSKKITDLGEDAMWSTVHGAGRTMSRREAKRTINQEEVDLWLEEFGVTVFGAGLDESPYAYRRLDEVLKAQGPTIEVVHTLKPLIVCMA